LIKTTGGFREVESLLSSKCIRGMPFSDVECSRCCSDVQLSAPAFGLPLGATLDLIYLKRCIYCSPGGFRKSLGAGLAVICLAIATLLRIYAPNVGVG
jgi:hypothetical protein